MSHVASFSQVSPFTENPQGPSGPGQALPRSVAPPPPPPPPQAAGNAAMLGAVGGQATPPPATLGFNRNLGNDAVSDLQKRKQQPLGAPPPIGGPPSAGGPPGFPPPAPGGQQFGPGERNPITGGILGPNEGGSISGPMAFNMGNVHQPIGGAPSQGGPPVGGPPPQGAQRSLANATDWMNLVHDPSGLHAWVQQQLGPQGGNDELVNYYTGKVQGQPGANETEQAGSAAYWGNKMAHDPKVTGIAAPPQGGGGGFNPLLQQLMMQAQGQQGQPQALQPQAPGYSDQMRQQLMQQMAMQGAIGRY